MTSPRERAQLQAALRQQQEALVRDLLPVLDALDRAESHWRQVVQGPGTALVEASRPPWWARVGERLWSLLPRWMRRWWSRGPHKPGQGEASAALARSAGEGIGLIRAQLLEVLQSHGLEPFESVGLPFDPERMEALGQRPAAAGLAPGQVVEEAVRGYLWQQKLLREARVLVAGP
jgi:molecular chaperone GrpE